eukprot:gene9790-biopygen2529
MRASVARTGGQSVQCVPREGARVFCACPKRANSCAHRGATYRRGTRGVRDITAPTPRLLPLAARLRALRPRAAGSRPARLAAPLAPAVRAFPQSWRRCCDDRPAPNLGARAHGDCSYRTGSPLNIIECFMQAL